MFDLCTLPPLPASAPTTPTLAGFPLPTGATAKVRHGIEFMYWMGRAVREIQTGQTASQLWPRMNIPIAVGTVTGATSTTLTDTDADFSTTLKCGVPIALGACRIVIYVKDDPRWICRIFLTGKSSNTVLTYDNPDWIARGIITNLSDLIGCKYLILAAGDYDAYDRWFEPPNSWEYISHDTGNVMLNGRKIYEPGAFAIFPSYKIITSSDAVGTFTVSVTTTAGTQTTPSMSVDNSSSDVQLAIQALSNVGTSGYAFDLISDTGLAFEKPLGTVTATVTPTLTAGTVTISTVTDLIVDPNPIWATSDWTHGKSTYPDAPTSFDLMVSDEGAGGDFRVRRFGISTVNGNVIGASLGGYKFSQKSYISIIKHGEIWNPHQVSAAYQCWYRGLYSTRFGLTHFPDDTINSFPQVLESVSFDDGNSIPDGCDGATLHTARDTDVWNSCCAVGCCSDPDRSYSPDLPKTFRYFQQVILNTSGAWVMPGYTGGAQFVNDWNFAQAAAIASAAEVAAGRQAISHFTFSISVTGAKAYTGLALPYDSPTLYYTVLNANGTIFQTGVQGVQKDGTGAYLTGLAGADGLSAVGSWGFDKWFEYEIKYDLPKTVWIPSLFLNDDGSTTAVDPPAFINDIHGDPQPYLGTFETRGISTKYCRRDSGQIAESGPTFAAGDLARLLKDNAVDPTLPSFDGTLVQPLLVYKDRLFSGKCGNNPTNGEYKRQEADRGVNSAVVSLGRTSGTVTQFTLDNSDLFNYWYTSGSNVLLHLQGVVSSSSGTALTGTISSDGSTFVTMVGSGWLDWVIFAENPVVVIEHTVSLVTTTVKLLATAAVKSTGTITLQALDGFTLSSGDKWHIYVPKYEINRLQNQRATVSVNAHGMTAARNVTVHITKNDQHTVFIDPADTTIITDDDMTAGIVIKSIMIESGSVVKRDPTNAFWMLPTGTDNRPDPNNSNIHATFRQKSQNNLPYTFHSFGVFAMGDYWRPELFNQFWAMNKTINEFRKDMGWDTKASQTAMTENLLFNADGTTGLNETDAVNLANGRAQFAIANAPISTAVGNGEADSSAVPGGGAPFSDAESILNPDCQASGGGNPPCGTAPCVSSAEVDLTAQSAYPFTEASICLGGSVRFFAHSPAIPDITNYHYFDGGSCTTVSGVHITGASLWTGDTAGLAYNAWAQVGAGTIGSDGYAYGGKVNAIPRARTDLLTDHGDTGIASGFTIDTQLCLIKPNRIYI